VVVRVNRQLNEIAIFLLIPCLHRSYSLLVLELEEVAYYLQVREVVVDLEMVLCLLEDELELDVLLVVVVQVVHLH